MKIYEVFTEVLYGPSHVVVANNESEAIEMTINYLNQSPTHHEYKPSDFYAVLLMLISCRSRQLFVRRANQ